MEDFTACIVAHPDTELPCQKVVFLAVVVAEGFEFLDPQKLHLLDDTFEIHECDL